VSDVSFGGPTLALSDIDQIEANQIEEEQKGANERLDGLLENLGSAAVALFDTGHRVLAVAFVLLVVVNSVLVRL
jgi:hypothetical protein